MKAFGLRSKAAGTDDTSVKVLDRTMPHARKRKILALCRRRPPSDVVYDYTPTRERAGPEKFLSTYKGYLQLDAYPAYDKLFREH